MNIMYIIHVCWVLPEFYPLVDQHKHAVRIQRTVFMCSQLMP